MIHIDGLCHRYGPLAVLDDVSFDVAAGEITALIGPTGCGKSTVLRVLAGLLQPTSGTAMIDGRSVIGRRGAAGWMPQADTLLPWRRAIDNAIIGATVRGTPRQVARRGAIELFERFGLAGFEQAWPGELSGGMRQRVALLRTVLTEAPVLLLDEPFGSLDAITRNDLQGWLAGLLADTGRTTVLVTHDIDEAMRLGDTIVVMSARPGRVLDRVRIAAPRPRTLTGLTNEPFTTIKRQLLAHLAPVLHLVPGTRCNTGTVGA